MKRMFKEVLSELMDFVSGKTIDALLPPLIYFIVYRVFGLKTAITGALSIALLTLAYRLYKKHPWMYSLAGFVGVAIASAFAYFGGNSANFFLPKIIGSGFALLIALVSLVLKKPLAAWLSHLSRGWALGWFWRHDIKPAYTEVTVIWMLFLFIRLFIQILLWQNGNLEQLFWANTLLGTPMTIVVLMGSYVYGIIRLSKLGGPGIDEYLSAKDKPWLGQRKGF